MIKQLLAFRLQQAFRFIKEIGLVYILVALLLTLGVLIRAITGFFSLSKYVSIILVFALLLSIHINRKDGRFLALLFDHKWSIKILYFCEYLLVASPLIIFQALNVNVSIVGGLLVCVALVALLPQIHIHQNNYKRFKATFIPLKNFEMRFALEQRFLIYGFLYLMSYLSFLHISLFIFGMVGICLFIMEAFKEGESKEMIDWSPTFLASKLFNNALLITLAYAPPFILAFIFQYESKYLILYLYVFILIHLFMVISYKYSSHNPIYKKMVNNVSVSCIFVTALFPGGILIALAFGIYHYFHANSHLKNVYA